MTPSADLQTFIAGLPKAELHVHHIGSATPETVAGLAARYEGSTDVPTDPADLTEYFAFTDFAHFVTVYLSVVNLIRDPQDIWTLTRDIGVDLARQNVRYAELTLSPYSAVTRGISAEAFCETVEDARRVVEAEHNITLRWCFDIPGESGVPAGDLTLQVALDQQPDGLVSFGLGGPEIGVPRSWFQPHFEQAHAAGLHSVPHAGESTGPETVWDALRLLGAERIGHGINAVHDPELVAHLASEGVPLEICPTSNVATKSVPSLADHPLPALAKAGVPFSIASDDPPMFSTTLLKEYAVAAELLGLDEQGVADLARASIHQSFATDGRKAAILDEIDAYTARCSGT